MVAGVNDWAKAFEKAGFKNVIMAKEAPTALQDSAWSLDDARHSAIVYKPEDKTTSKGLYPRIGDYDKWAIEWGYK